MRPSLAPAGVFHPDFSGIADAVWLWCLMSLGGCEHRFIIETLDFWAPLFEQYGHHYPSSSPSRS
jgi:hypothetical protein